MARSRLIGDDVLAQLGGVARHTDPVMAADVTAARALIEAGRAIQAANLADGERRRD